MNEYHCPHCKRTWYTEEKALTIPRHTTYGGDFTPTTPVHVKECVTSGATIHFGRNHNGKWTAQALFIFLTVCLCRVVHHLEQFMR